MEEILIPIAFFLTVGVPVSLALLFRYRSRREVQQTLRASIEKGQDLTPELLECLSEVLEPRNRDLRRGIIAIALSLAFVALALIVDEADAFRPLLGAATFPLFIGLAYLVLWRLSGQEK